MSLKEIRENIVKLSAENTIEGINKKEKLKAQNVANAKNHITQLMNAVILINKDVGSSLIGWVEGTRQTEDCIIKSNIIDLLGVEMYLSYRFADGDANPVECKVKFVKD